jgi:hypothetical protein
MNPHFVGREDVLTSINNHFVTQRKMGTSDSPQTASFAICGPAGQGKTQTAVKYLYDYHDQFAAAWLVSVPQYLIRALGLSLRSANHNPA